MPISGLENLYQSVDAKDVVERARSFCQGRIHSQMSSSASPKWRDSECNLVPFIHPASFESKSEFADAYPIPAVSGADAIFRSDMNRHGV